MNETLGVHQSLIDAELDAPKILLHDGQYEVDHIEFVLKGNPIQEGKEEEEVEEIKEEEEEEELEEEFDRYQISEKADE